MAGFQCGGESRFANNSGCYQVFQIFPIAVNVQPKFSIKGKLMRYLELVQNLIMMTQICLPSCQLVLENPSCS